jgi:hypothetical protein
MSSPSADRERRRRGGPGDWRSQAWGGGWRPGWDEPQRQSDVPAKRVRIGDAERDQAVSLLSDHFVAGRLTQTEFEERSEQATRSRYTDDLEPLFDDLPTSMELQVASHGPAGVRRRPGSPPPFMMLMPFLMIGLVISSIALTAPWLLWGVFWIVLMSGMSRRRWGNYRR